MKHPELPYLVVKIGGRPAADLGLIDNLMRDLKTLSENYRTVLVHGGGAEVSTLSSRLGLEPRFVDGIRMTTVAEMDVVDMILAGTMNTRLLRRATLAGLRAVGLSGVDAGLFTASSIGTGADGAVNRTGRIAAIDRRVIDDLAGLGYLPVLSSVALDSAGAGLNINADDAALALAQELSAHTLVFVSDIPGVLKNRSVIGLLTPGAIEEEIAAGVIQGGMIPKVRAAAAALQHGVRRVCIGEFRKEGDLPALAEGRSGTRIESVPLPKGDVQEQTEP